MLSIMKYIIVIILLLMFLKTPVLETSLFKDAIFIVHASLHASGVYRLLSFHFDIKVTIWYILSFLLT